MERFEETSARPFSGAHEINRAARDLLHLAAAHCRYQGIPWEVLGDVLGTGRSNAYSRFGPFCREWATTHPEPGSARDALVAGLNGLIDAATELLGDLAEKPRTADRLAIVEDRLAKIEAALRLGG